MGIARTGAGPDQLTRPRRMAWLAGVGVALAFHTGAIAYAVLLSRMPDEDVALGAPAIEIGLTLASPQHEDANLPPGPEADDAAASSAALDQTAKAEPDDLAKDQPVETDDPARVVSPKPPETPKEKEPEQQRPKTEQATEAAASEAAAAPKIETARVAPQSTAPAIGSGASDAKVVATWQKTLVAHLHRFKRYPRDASRRSAEVIVAFTLDRFGHVVAARVEKGSGDPAFDRAALDMMKNADPVPAPPPLVADERLSFALPVVFREKRR